MRRRFLRGRTARREQLQHAVVVAAVDALVEIHGRGRRHAGGRESSAATDALPTLQAARSGRLQPAQILALVPGSDRWRRRSTRACACSSAATHSSRGTRLHGCNLRLHTRRAHAHALPPAPLHLASTPSSFAFGAPRRSCRRASHTGRAPLSTCQPTSSILVLFTPRSPPPFRRTPSASPRSSSRVALPRLCANGPLAASQPTSCSTHRLHCQTPLTSTSSFSLSLLLAHTLSLSPRLLRTRSRALSRSLSPALALSCARSCICCAYACVAAAVSCLCGGQVPMTA